MKKLYGICDGQGGISCTTDQWSIEAVELVPNPTWEQDDYTDEEGGHWIRADRLAFLFDELCKSTGMTQKALAEYCGKTPKTFSNYVTGKSPVPMAIWKLVEQRRLK